MLNDEEKLPFGVAFIVIILTFVLAYPAYFYAYIKKDGKQ